MKRKSTYAWAKYGFVVKEKDESHDIRREEEDDNKINYAVSTMNVHIAA